MMIWRIVSDAILDVGAPIGIHKMVFKVLKRYIYNGKDTAEYNFVRLE